VESLALTFASIRIPTPVTDCRQAGEVGSVGANAMSPMNKQHYVRRYQHGCGALCGSTPLTGNHQILEAPVTRAASTNKHYPGSDRPPSRCRCAPSQDGYEIPSVLCLPGHQLIGTLTAASDNQLSAWHILSSAIPHVRVSQGGRNDCRVVNNRYVAALARLAAQPY
jgi:hypothetical protein